MVPGGGAVFSSSSPALPASNSNDGSAARFFVGLGATCPSSPPFGYRFGLFSPQQQQEQGTEEEEAAEGAAAEAEEQEQEEVSG